MSGFIYFIAPEAARVRDEESLKIVKIGYTKANPMARMRELQCGSPVSLELLAYIDGPVALEKAYHEAFAPLRDHGEWFLLHGKLRDFLWYFDVGGPQTERYFPRDAVLDAVNDNIFARSAPHPSITDEEYMASADPAHLAAWYSELFR